MLLVLILPCLSRDELLPEFKLIGGRGDDASDDVEGAKLKFTGTQGEEVELGFAFTFNLGEDVHARGSQLTISLRDRVTTAAAPTLVAGAPAAAVAAVETLRLGDDALMPGLRCATEVELRGEFAETALCGSPSTSTCAGTLPPRMALAVVSVVAGPTISAARRGYFPINPWVNRIEQVRKSARNDFATTVGVTCCAEVERCSSSCCCARPPFVPEEYIEVAAEPRTFEVEVEVACIRLK